MTHFSKETCRSCTVKHVARLAALTRDKVPPQAGRTCEQSMRRPAALARTHAGIRYACTAARRGNVQPPAGRAPRLRRTAGGRDRAAAIANYARAGRACADARRDKVRPQARRACTAARRGNVQPPAGRAHTAARRTAGGQDVAGPNPCEHNEPGRSIPRPTFGRGWHAKHGSRPAKGLLGSSATIARGVLRMVLLVFFNNQSAMLYLAVFELSSECLGVLLRCVINTTEPFHSRRSEYPSAMHRALVVILVFFLAPSHTPIPALRARAGSECILWSRTMERDLLRMPALVSPPAVRQCERGRPAAVHCPGVRPCKRGEPAAVFIPACPRKRGRPMPACAAGLRRPPAV